MGQSIHPGWGLMQPSEVVALGVVERHGVLELLDAVVVELVRVVGEGLELLDDVLEGVELLVGQSELLGLVALHDDVGTGDSAPWTRSPS